MDDCVFCKIVKGEIPTHKVFEDDHFLVFMDIHPMAPGAVQVIPKKHYRWVWDVPNVASFFEIARKIAKAEQKAFNTQMVLSKIVGEEVGHAHIWVYPNPGVAGDPKDFEGNAEKIKKELQ